MNHNHRSNPLHVAALCATLVLAMVMLLDPLFPPSPYRSAGAVGVFNAIEAVGQLDENNNTDFTSNTPNRFSGFDTVPNARGVNFPWDVVIDGSDNRLFVSDASNNRVLVFELDGTNDLTDYEADFVIGQTDFASDISGTDERTMSFPGALAYDDSANRLFVADTGNNRVLVFDASPANLASEAAGLGTATNAVNVLGQPDFFTVLFDTTDSEFNDVGGLAYDGTRLYVSDTFNNRVMVFHVAAITDGEPAVNELGQDDPDADLDFFNDGQPNADQGIANQIGLDGPAGLAYDGTNLYVADTNNNRVMVFDVGGISDGEPAVNELGQNDDDLDTDFFNDSIADVSIYGMQQPSAVAYSSSGTRLFVSDRNNNRVTVFDVAPITNGEDAINVIGQEDFTSNSSDTTIESLDSPRGVAVDAVNERLYVADSNNNRVMFFDVDPAALIPNTPATDGPDATNAAGQVDGTTVDYNSSSSDNQDHPFSLQQTSSQGLNDAHGVSHDEAGGSQLFVADTGNNRVLVHTGGLPTTDGFADIVLGQADMTASMSATTDTGMRGPQGVAFDGFSLFVADTGNNRVLVFDTASFSDGMPADFVLGQATMTASASATTPTGMNAPTAVLVDASGTFLYVSDTGNNRVLVFAISSIVNGAPAANVLGQLLFTTSAAATTQSGLDGPTGLAHDGTNLYVADTDNSRATVFDVTTITNGEPAVHVLGQTLFTTSVANTTQDGLDGPSGLAYLPYTSRLAVADSNNNRVMFFDVAAITNGENAVQAIGQSDYVTGTNDTTQADFSMSGVAGLSFYDIGHVLFVADAGNHRVMEFGLERITTTSLPDAGVGSSYFAIVSEQYGQGTIVFTLASGSLPPGLSLAPSGSITGTPTTSGMYVFTVEVTDSIGPGTFTDTQELSIAVDEPYAATDLLGQITDDTDLPRWTASKSMGLPNGVTGVDQAGFVLDSVHHRFFYLDATRVLVHNLDVNDQFTDYIPDAVLGAGSVYETYLTFGGGVSASTFNNVEDIEYDGVNDRLFVVDRADQRVLVFDTDTITDGEDAIYVFGQTDFTTTTSGLSATKFSNPQEAEYDSVNDRLYVSEQGNRRVVVFDADPASLVSNGNAAFAVLGQPDFTTNTAGTTASKFSSPYGITTDASATKLYVVDGSNNRVLRFDISTLSPTGEVAEHVLGQAGFGTSGSGLSSTQFSDPKGVALDESGSPDLLFVGDRSNCRVMVFDIDTMTDGEAAVNWLGGGSAFTNTSCVPSSQGNRASFFAPGNKLTDPYDVEFDAGNSFLYVADRNSQRVVVYDTSTIVNAEVYTSTVGQVTAADVNVPDLATNGNTSGRGLLSPGGITLDTAGQQLFIVDPGADGTVTQRVLRFELDGTNNLTDRVADSVLGRQRLRDYTFSSLAISASTSAVTTHSGLAYDETNGRLFVADDDRNRVLIFDATTVTDGESATNVLGQTTFTGSGTALTQRGMNEPMGLTFDEAGQRLFVADNNNNRVMVYDVSPANIASDGNGSDAIAVLGQPNFTTGTAGTTQSKLNNPTRLAYDADRQLLFVTDLSNCRVMVWDVTTVTNGDFATNVLGKATFGTSFCTAGQAGFSTPTGLAYDSDNLLLWVLDSAFSRATLFDLATITDGEPAIGVIGQNNYSESTSVLAGASQNRFFGGQQLAFDATHNRLYVVVDPQHRVMLYEFIQQTTAAPPAGGEGDPYSAPLSATGYQGTLAFEIASGSLPPGLSITGTTIDGTPTTQGTFDFTLRAVDEYGVSTFVDDMEHSITVGPGTAPTPTPTPGNNNNPPPPGIGFTPIRIEVNQDNESTDSRNVLVKIFASNTSTFTGTVDVLLSNDTSFTTFVPFRYNIPGPGGDQNIWPVTIAWDLCFGLREGTPCDPGRKTVYARFYVNVPAPSPALTPRP